jgi:uncharacterized membrane protein YozB (DUF420 family)
LIGIHDLPAVNATLNGTAAILLTTGLLLIRRGRRVAHKRVMITAFCVSVVFLTCYLVYHAHVGSVHYPHTHTVLAVTVPVLAIITLRRALKGQFQRHRAIARWTMPIWLYVSVTGVVVYLMLYQF